MDNIIETNSLTLTRFLLKQQQRLHASTGELTQLLSSIQTACKAISCAVRQAGMAKLFGTSGDTNYTGDKQQKLDVIANELFINCISTSYSACSMISEENDTIIHIPKKRHGKYVVMFDPLDGSSNIDCLVTIGSIFSIYKRKDEDINVNQFLRSGRSIVAAGYVLYGNATMFVLATEHTGVNGFTLDPALGEFILTDQDIKIKEKGLIYSVNEGYESYFDQKLKDYIHCLKSPTDNQIPYSSRYVGSMVADVHRTLKYGGIFMYPASSKSPDGKIRLLYEANPLAYVIEQAGGLATNLHESILDIVPTNVHMRIPVFLGSKLNVEEAIKACR